MVPQKLKKIINWVKTTTYDYDSLYFRIQKYTDARKGTKRNKRKR